MAKGIKIIEVEGESLAAELELSAGDRVWTVNGRRVRDALDFKFLTAGEEDLTLEVITGIFMPDSGEVRWLGDDTGTAFRDRIGYLPEERGLYKQMKVWELLVFLAEIKGYRPADIRKRVDGWLERFELTDKRDAKVEELSKGNQQKVQLIGTLLHDPD